MLQLLFYLCLPDLWEGMKASAWHELSLHVRYTTWEKRDQLLYDRLFLFLRFLKEKKKKKNRLMLFGMG